MKRNISFILTLLMLASSFLSSLTSCQKAEQSFNSTLNETASETILDTTEIVETPETGEDGRLMHNVPDNLDFGGETFTIVYPNWQGYTSCFFAEEFNGDLMNDALYNRTLTVENYLGIDIINERHDYSEGVSEAVTQSIISGDDIYQLVLTHCILNVASFVSRGFLYNYDDLQFVDYSAEWWNREQMDALRLGRNTYYGVSDYMIPCPYVIYFNKNMIEENQLGNPYQLVYNKKWTIDKFMEMSAAVTRDTDGDGKITSKDNCGVCYDEISKFVSFMTGANQFMMTKNAEGRYEMAMNTEKMISLIEKFASFANITGVIAAPGTMNVNGGNLLFYLNPISEATVYRESDYDIGILPYPLYDEEQNNYISLDWGGLMCIPNIIKNPDLVGATLELLAYESNKEVIPAYYNVVLDGKVARDKDTVAMLDIIFDTIAYEPGGNYFGFDAGTGTYFFMLPNLAIDKKSTDFASWDKSNIKVANNTINKFYNDLDKIEGNS